MTEDEQDAGGQRAGQRPKASLWYGLLKSWHSMLGSIDYVRSLSSYQVAALRPPKILELDAKICYLDIEGMRVWDDQQVNCLESRQLTALTVEQAEVIAGRCSPLTLKRWVMEGRVSALIEQLPGILDGVGGDEVKVQSMGQGIENRVNAVEAGRILLFLTEVIDDSGFRLLIGRVSIERLQEIVLSDVGGALEADDIFNRRLDEELKAFARRKMQYEHEEGSFNNLLAEVKRFRQRILLCHHLTVRQQIYAEFEEWILELPLTGLSRFLIPMRQLFALSRRDQDHTLDRVLTAITNSIEGHRQRYLDENQSEWMTFGDLKKTLTALKRRLTNFEKKLHASEKHIDSAEKQLQPFAERLPEMKDDPTIVSAVDERITVLREAVKELEPLAEEIKKLAASGEKLKKGVENQLDFLRLSEDDSDAGADDDDDTSQYVGALPIILFKRIVNVVTSAVTRSDADYDSLWEKANVVCCHPAICAANPQMRHFQGHCQLYIEVCRYCHRVDILFQRFESLRTTPKEIAQKHRDLFLRCLHKVVAWESIKAQALGLYGRDHTT